MNFSLKISENDKNILTRNGLAMLALLILPFVDVTSLFPGAEVRYLSGWGYWLVSELQFAFYLVLIWLLRKELKAFTWRALWTEDFSLFLKKAALLTFVPSALNIFFQLGTTNHLVMDFSTSVWLFLVSLACDLSTFVRTDSCQIIE